MSTHQKPFVEQVDAVFDRAAADPSGLSYLTDAERPAFAAGRADRAWARGFILATGFVVGICVMSLFGCGGSNEPIADSRMTIDPPNCAASGVCS